MTVSLKYIGAAQQYFETGSTGAPTQWRKNQTMDVSDANAVILLATGLFTTNAIVPARVSTSGGVSTIIDDAGNVVSVGNPGTTAVATITGTYTVGSVLTAAPSTGYSFVAGQWNRAGVAISGATGVTYTLALADSGMAMSFTPTNPTYTAPGSTVAIVVYPATVSFVTEGDSITNGLGSSGVGFRYPDNALAYLPTSAGAPVYTLNDIGTSGITANTISANYATRGGAAYDATKVGSIFTLLAGTNDGASTNFITIYRNLRTILRKAKASGYQRRVIGTLTSRNDGVAPDGSWDANTLPLNVAIRAYALNDLDCDAVSDFAANAAFSTAAAANSTTNYTDKLHPTNAGYVIMGQIHGTAVGGIVLAPTARTMAPATWSPFDVSGYFTLSNANRTIAWTSAGFSQASTRCFAGAATGKYAWEISIDNAQYASVGLCNQGFEPSIASNQYGLINNVNSIGYNGTQVSYNSAVIATLGTLTTGDVIQHAVDLDAKLLWMRRSSGLWNGNASANPVTGVGGIDISGLGAGPRYPCANISSAGGILTSRFAASEMSAQLSGFRTFG